MDELPDPSDPDQRAACVARAQQRSVHPDVLAHLSGSVRTNAQRRSLDALKSGVAVVTGQQAGLFGGPLYTLHKAVAAIVDAQALQAETGVPCAPVFWLQDEDHDFEEIRAATLLAADGTLLRAELPADPSRRRVADRVLGPGIDAALATLTEALGQLPHAAEVERLFRDSHTASTSVSAAFSAVVASLFADHGLLVLDPAAPELQAAAAPVHARAIDAAVPVAEALRRRAEALQARGRPVPVHVRPDAPLSFVHPDGLAGPRFRAVPVDGGFELVGDGRVLSAQALQRGPHSTSALLRPLLQDHWLPTAAYVGGPGELRYLEQLPPLWPLFDLPVPLVVHRARFLLVDAPARKLLERLSLAASAALADRDELLERLGRAGEGHTDPDAVHGMVVAGRDELAAFAAEAEAIDANLAKSVRKTVRHLDDVAGKVSDRYRRSLARRDEVTMDRLDRLRTRLCPDGAPQERVLAWPTFGARVGPAALVQQLLAAARPFDGSLTEVTL